VLQDGGKQIGSLTTHQMDALWFAFDELAPSYYRRAKLHVVQLRRLLLLAHINPDGYLVFPPTRPPTHLAHTCPLDVVAPTLTFTSKEYNPLNT
jgi:hypothetical protein